MKTDTAKSLVLSQNLFPVIGIGASAGGLEAFTRLIQAIPEHSGMAYVLVQHLHSDFVSILPELLQRVTIIPVEEISDDVKVLPDHIYVIPSNKMLKANDGVLLLSSRPDKEQHSQHLPIDLFFTSLAEVHQAHAIGVVLSGTAQDGTLGLKAIKDQGGITFAQNESSADFEGMPNSAVLAGVVDFVLPPEEIPQKLLDLKKGVSLSDSELLALPATEEEAIKKILVLLRQRKGTDFTYYKQTTVRRRILRQMAINKTALLVDYFHFVEQTEGEQDILYQDLLIPVTSFFRDKQVFDTLSQSVFPQLVKGKKGNEPVRIWVAGCSTGEEAYSFAIYLREYFGSADVRVQIFATDISEPAIIKARRAFYTKKEVEGVSPGQLQSFFVPANDGYQVNKDIRDTCIFAVHNFVKDPPFGRLDLVSCRNVLIYMEPYLQKKAITTFHYALKPKGFLWLGKSESASSVPELFTAEATTDKLFIRKDASRRYMHVASVRNELGLRFLNAETINETVHTDFGRAADELMLSRYMPVGVVVNEDMDIVEFRGNTQVFLEQGAGKPSHNLLKMAKEGLSFELRSLLRKVKKENTAVKKEHILLQTSSGRYSVSVEAVPLPKLADPHYLIIFKEVSLLPDTVVTTSARKGAALHKQHYIEYEHQIRQLEAELLHLREDMRQVTEDQEAANEELQSANEELLSSSEEFQSMNEELEVSYEELQSSNEELSALNQELVNLNEQVNAAKDYAEAIIATFPEPLVVLDDKLRIKTVNGSFLKSFALDEEQTKGKVIYDLGGKQWNIPSLQALLEEVLPERKEIEDFELGHRFPLLGERLMLLNAREIITKQNPEKLILLAIRNVTERAQHQLRESELLTRFQALVMQAPVAIVILKGTDYLVEMANNFYLQLVGRGADLIGKPILESLPELKTQGIKELLEGVLQTGKPFYGNEREIYLFRNSKEEPGFFNFVYNPMREHDGTISGVIVVVTEVTDQVLSRKKIEESEHRYANMIYSSPSLISILEGENMVIKIANDAIIESWGKGEDVIEKPYFKVLPELAEQGVKEILQGVYQSGIPYYATEFPLSMMNNGKMKLKYFNLVCQPQHNEAGKIEGVAIISNEVTPQAEYNIKMKESEERFRLLADQVPLFVFLIEPDAEATVSYWNKNWLHYTGQSVEEAIGQSWNEIIHPDDVPGVMAVYIPAFEKQQPFILPRIRLKRRDGAYRWHTVKASPRYLPTGEFIGFIGVGIDVHEKELADEALKESEERFRNLVEKSPSPIFILKRENMILEVANEPVFAIWNVKREAMGKPFLEILPEMKDQPLIGWVQDVFKTGATYYANEQPVYFLQKNGEKEVLYFNFVYQPYREDDGTISGVMIIANDISEQVVARKKMEVQATMVQELLMTAPGFICTLSGPEHIYQLVNERYQQLFGTRQIQGKPILVALPELEGQGFDTLLDTVYTTGETYVGIDIPIMLSHDEGLAPRLHYFNFSYQPMYDENKKIFSILVFGYEVTEQVLAKSKLLDMQQQYAKELEEKVQYRTGELRETNRLLTKTNEELEAFSYVSSHDLQEPLRKLRTYAARILEKEYATLSDTGKDYFVRMNNAAGRMQSLIEDLLAYSHANISERRFEKTSLDAIVEVATVDFEEIIEEKGAFIEKGELGSAIVNPVQFRQVMNNLLSNALKFSKPGVPPHITVKSSRGGGSNFQAVNADIPAGGLSPEKFYCHLSFTDNGIGFNPEYKEKIFEVFQRLHGKEEYEGTGIGLSIIKKIVENHGGVITATGEVGKGAQFDIYIPVPEN